MPSCARCTQSVFFAEGVQALGKHFHRRCFICSNESCGRSLDSRNCADHKSKPYCAHCYRREFGPTGVGSGGNYGSASIVAPTTGNNPRPPRYETARAQSIPPPADRACYGSNFDPVTAVISYGDGGARTKRIAEPKIDEMLLLRIAERELEDRRYQNAYAMGGTNNRSSPNNSSGRPTSCAGSTTTGSSAGALDDDDEVLSSAVDSLTRRQSGPNGLGLTFGSTIPKTTTCRKCSKPVYEAEKILAAGATWHRATCFSCEDCRRRLDARTLCERDGALYCNNCYSKCFGPRAYGHGSAVGATTLLATSSPSA